eukprot:ctg_923.g406
MHGVRRGAQASSDLAEQWAAEERYIRLGEEAGRVLASRYADDTQKFLSDSARVLRENPEEYSLWNRRREILLEALRHRPFDPQATLSPLPKTAAEAFEEELALSAQALQSNPKAYAAWAHRVWLLRVCSGVGDHSGARPSSYAAQALRKELQLCERVLQMDDRGDPAERLHRGRRFSIGGVLDSRSHPPLHPIQTAAQQQQLLGVPLPQRTRCARRAPGRRARPARRARPGTQRHLHRAQRSICMVLLAVAAARMYRQRQQRGRRAARNEQHGRQAGTCPRLGR